MLKFFLRHQERRLYHPEVTLTLAVFVGLGRGFLERSLHNIAVPNSHVIAFIPFYWCLALLYSSLLSPIVRLPYARVAGPVNFAILLGFFPPILDAIAGTTSAFYAYYLSKNPDLFPWLAYNPAISYPAGEAITIWLSFMFMTWYTWVKTHSFQRSAFALILAYGVFLFQSLLIPQWVSFSLFPDVMNPTDGSLAAYQVVSALYGIGFLQSFVAINTYSLFQTRLRRHLLRRFWHILPFVALTIFGVYTSQGDIWSYTTAVFMTWQLGHMSLLINDRYDARYESDYQGEIIVRTDTFLSTGTTFLMLLMLMQTGSAAFLPFSLAAISLYFYSHPFYRAKRYFPGNLKLEGLWSACVFLGGAMFRPSEFRGNQIYPMALLLFAGGSLISVFKDRKDVDTDKSSGNRTFYTINLGSFWTVRRRHVTLVSLSWIALATVLLVWRIQSGPISLRFMTILFAGSITYLISAWYTATNSGFRRFLIVLIVWLILQIREIALYVR